MTRKGEFGPVAVGLLWVFLCTPPGCGSNSRSVGVMKLCPEMRSAPDGINMGLLFQGSWLLGNVDWPAGKFRIDTASSSPPCYLFGSQKG